MKHICNLFLLSFLTFAISSQAQVAATYSSSNSGLLDGVPFVFTNIQGTSSMTATDLSGANYSAAPLSSNQIVLSINTNSNWTLTFDTPVSNLRLYGRYWRNSLFEFDQPFTVLSGDNLENPVGNQLQTTMFGSGIIEFNNPITTLNITVLSNSLPSNAYFTLGLDDTLSTPTFDLAESIRVYPNPANNMVSINTEVKKITITDVTGKQVMTTTQNKFNIVTIK